MRKVSNLTDQTFERLVAIAHMGSNKYSGAIWLCYCSCGKFRIVSSVNLKRGNTQSCGCLHREISKKINTTHGMTHSSENKSWGGSIQRCTNPKNKKYKDYGARGITVCPEWRESFEAFYRDMGPKPSPQHSLGRRDNNGPYSKDNCKWETDIEQQNNTRVNKFLTYSNKTQTLVQWSRELNINRNTLASRLQRHKDWPMEKVLSKVK